MTAFQKPRFSIGKRSTSSPVLWPAHSINSIAVVCLAVTALFGLDGCGGWRMNLAKVPISSMQVSQAKEPGIAPGEKSQLVVAIVQPDGKTFKTVGEEDEEKISWKDLAVTAAVVSANAKGVVSLPDDPQLSEGKLPHVTVTVPSHPDLRAEIDIPIRYDRNFSADFSGSSGSSGLDGQNGSNGFDGTPGSTDPQYPRAGGNGSDGGSGTDGDRGHDGEDGPAVQVRVALKPGSDAMGAHPLLQVTAAAKGFQFGSRHNAPRRFLVDPQGGSVTIKSQGGAGGSGGRGGHGGRGGSGGIGSPNGSSGRDGSNGHDGLSGWSGKGGPITVSYDPAVKPYLSAIRLINPGGPRPVMIEESVGPLW